MGAHCRTRSKRGCDDLQDPCSVLHDIVVPETKYSPPVLAQRPVPHFVIAGALVLSSVGLDDETGLYTGKVDNMGWDWMLPSKAPAELVIAQLTAEEPLRFCRVPAQTASTSDHRRSASHRPKLA